MSDNPFDPPTAPTTEAAVTMKAGKGYDAPWITLRGASVAEVLTMFKDAGSDLSSLFREVNGASISFQEDLARRDGAPEPKKYGKPENADSSPQPKMSDEPPFGASAAGKSCQHGEMTLVEHAGKKGYVCPLPKGTQGRCDTVFV
jgi:hypothetical protein